MYASLGRCVGKKINNIFDQVPIRGEMKNSAVNNVNGIPE